VATERKDDLMVFSTSFVLFAVAPFNFELSARIFANGDPEIRRYENGMFWQAIRIGSKLALACVESVGDVDLPKLKVNLKTTGKLTEEDKKSAAKTIANIFNLEFSLEKFYKEIKCDKILTALATKLRGLKNPTTQFAFEALIDSIVEQQISLKVANAFERRIVKKWGDSLKLNHETYYAYPTPKALASATKQDLRAIGLSERKAEYVRNSARLLADRKLDLEALRLKDKTTDIIEELDKVKGIGIWTAELTMIRGMQRLEAFPADDLGLRRTMSYFYGSNKQITNVEARKIAENWGRWKGVAAYYLIVAEILNLRV
jgi:DNA-3-methyladenine glycosylase II